MKPDPGVVSWLSIPNYLSAFRLITAPIILYFAWTGKSDYFLILLAVSLLSDALDGFLARRLNMTSTLGAKLDSWGDFAIYITAPVCAWLLWPEVIQREAVFVLLAIIAYVIPLIVGYLKFGRLTSYHTWSAKGAAVLMTISIFLLFMVDISWPFRCFVFFHVLGACEEIVITYLLPEWRCNVPSLWHAMKLVKKERKSKT